MNSQIITNLQIDKIIVWKKYGIKLDQDGFMGLVEQNHAFNYQLWHAEDRARRDDMGFEYVYKAKREIDQCNQQRNNRMEAMDQYLWEHLQPSAASETPVHSETPGMIIDRLSILALKAYHMEQQTARDEATEDHRQSCQQKLSVILTQQHQLAKCLDELFSEVQNGNRTFRVYHQFKMYNDPSLNPQLYSSKKPCEDA